MNKYNRPTVYSPRMSDILYWVEERENIRLKKEAGEPAPWTDDPILGKYRFCNVRRRDDRLSKWIMKNLLDDDRYEDKWFVAAIARMINWPPALLALKNAGAIPERVEKFDPDLFIKVLEELKATGAKIFGGAYVVYPGKETGVNKSETVAKRFLSPLVENVEDIREALNRNSVEVFVNTITRFFGWDSFIAGQVAADLTTYSGELDNAKDLYTFSPIGPGSSRGLNRLIGRELNAKWRQETFNDMLIYIQREIAEQLGLYDLTLHDVNNVMCEVDKMWRVLAGEGTPRSLYKHETAY